MQIKLNEFWVDILTEIVQQNNLGPTDFLFDPKLDEIIEKGGSIFDTPFFVLKEIIFSIVEGKEKIENLPNLIKKDLNLSDFLGEKIAKEIREKIFFLPESPIEEKETFPKKKRIDIYREPIE